MGTIDDIVFDTDYSHAIWRFLLLNDEYPNQNGPSPVILLRHASLMKFIHVFRNLIQCQQHINNDNQKMITLVISNRKLIDWNDQINIIDTNIDKVYIFCDTYFDYIRMKRWNGCYRNKIQSVYPSDAVDYNLILLGIDYIRTVMSEFRQDQGLCAKYRSDALQLIGALAGYFQDQADSVDSMEENT